MYNEGDGGVVSWEGKFSVFSVQFSVGASAPAARGAEGVASSRRSLSVVARVVCMVESVITWWRGGQG